ncbi:LysR family transcriptional regulator [Aneurinibacillus sp. Ricciae_BoGa-3]|uniref:LysR family transcriptional regulator n=1 Tax=Aneurinibacillus sp. Ricciae_BoGa-3 TaxID=3022697 RepID=UPI0023420CCC|nr:LysR family transcriptional regulator [Aneurinibacillus sp. Ricciae_BoGa-3]WCK54948.1 LysR family transcriptional regulator [Aneurinibacillus sp. Ricciae_BoGa-3]
MFTLNQLRYFTVAIDKGSLNQAAKELFVSQSALTKQLAKLEEGLECRLFIRKPSGIEATEAGKVLYEKALRILAEIKDTAEAIKRFAERVPFRIGALPSLANHYLPRLPGYKKSVQHPTEIMVKDTTAELITLLQEKQIDAAFVQDYESHPQLITLHLFKEPYTAVLPASHPLTTRDSLSFDMLTQHNMILHKDPCDIRTSFRRHCSELGIEPKISLELDFNESILPFVSAGYGVSILPKISADSIQDPSLCVKEIKHDPFFRTISAFFHAQAQPHILELLAGGNLLNH